MIREYGILRHKKRQEFLSSMIEGIIKSCSVVFSEIADKIDKPIKEESMERRIQDFFQKVSIDFFKLGILMPGFVHHKKVLLSIDRTEWDFGGTQVNILCAVVSIGIMAASIYFDMLGHRHTGCKNKPRKWQKHGYPQISAFRRELNIMRKLYKKKLCFGLIHRIMTLAENRIRDMGKTIG